MRGLIAVTDHEWFEYLASIAPVDEVNFWRPSDTRTPRQLEVGTPVLFKLRKRFGGWIVGYGLFANHDVFPAWLAWDNFDVKNGAKTFAEMRARIERLRSDAPEASQSVAGDYQIGCLMLAEPVFFSREDWVKPPADWPENAVQGKTYDLASGEGARVWSECLDRSRSERGRLLGSALRDRRGPPTLIQPRLGQGIFRSEVIAAYGRACAVTQEHSLPALEAAHIKPFAGDGEHHVSNGLLLRSDIHRLFDKGYVGVDRDMRFLVSGRLKDDFENGRSYYPLHGKSITVPSRLEHRPDPANLRWHLESCYRQ